MNTKSTTITKQHIHLSRVALGTGLLLLVPLLGRFPWTLSDFLIMGALIFGTGLTYEVIVNKVTEKYRVVFVVTLVVLFFLTWAELAVGIFGSPFAGS